MNAKIILSLLGIAGVLYLAWPIIKLVIMGYFYRFIIEYGFYMLLLLAGGGYYFWRRLKSAKIS
ncbi:MAG: hypothetical protein O3C58_14050 [Nitrospinae bacterium]|nr:hypothetical protein [Nitrospinota bacterium]